MGLRAAGKNRATTVHGSTPDAVRDALVYHGNVAADRVETRWTGESRQTVVTANNVPAGANRVVDIAIH